MRDIPDAPVARSLVRRVVLTTLLFLFAGPMIAGPITIAIVWYLSLPDMTLGKAAISGVFVTLLGFWAIIAFGAVPAIATGLTVGLADARYGKTGIMIPLAAGLVFGAIWGMLIQRNISEFVGIAPAVALGAAVASGACWWLVRRARAMRARQMQ